MKVGDLVNWYHQYTGERKILYVIEIIDDETVRCLFSYGAHQDIKRDKLTLFKDVTLQDRLKSRRWQKETSD